MSKRNEGAEPEQTGSEANKLLTGKQWFTVSMVVLAVALTGIINVAVREYYRADVRYEEGSWYYSEDSAIVSLRIKNHGAADAENVVFTASFSETVQNASVGDPSIDCEFADQKDPRTITGRIKRLVPKQTAFVYFDITHSGVAVSMEEKPFVRSMAYDGGQGKTGEPRRRWFLDMALMVLLLAFGGPPIVLMAMRTHSRATIQADETRPSG